MTLPERLRKVLPADTARSWEIIAPAIPPQAYLAGGTAVAVHLADLLAMKINAIGGRSELRDYFDLMIIQKRTGRRVEEGLALFLTRFAPTYPGQAIDHIIRSLGYFDDVDPDDALPATRKEIVEYWTRRQQAIVADMDQLE